MRAGLNVFASGGDEEKLTAEVLSIRLFGDMEVSLNNTPIQGLHLREGTRLLAYLTLRHGMEISYRQLAQKFWPSEARLNDEFDGGEYPSTRQAIYTLRRTLGSQEWRIERVGKGLIRFNLDGADVDYARFFRLVGSEDPTDWRQALLLHRAPLLEDWQEDWAVETRTRCLRSVDRIRQALKALPATPTEEAEGISDTARGAGETSPVTGEQSDTELDEETRDEMPEADGGAVPLGSRYYIERNADALFGQAVARHDSVILVKGARQVGKTSLLARGLDIARQAGKAVVLTDFQKLNATQLESIDALYIALATSIALQLELDVMPRQVWDPDFGSNMNMEMFLRRYVLKKLDTPLIWGMDEVDRLFSCPFGSEVFGLFRSWHNERALNPGSPWSRLSLAIVYATEAHLFITDLNQSPFNVGTRLMLDDFTLENLSDLNHRHGDRLSAEEISRLHLLVGGQPYLVRRAFSALRHEGMSFARIEQEAPLEEGLFGDHLRRILLAITRSSDLREVIYAMLAGEPCPSPDDFYRLRTAGLLSGTSTTDATFRCQLYEAFLRRHLM